MNLFIEKQYIDIYRIQDFDSIPFYGGAGLVGWDAVGSGRQGSWFFAWFGVRISNMHFLRCVCVYMSSPSVYEVS